MSFGIAKDVRSEVRVCTPDLLNEALDAPQVAKVCAEIEDALEALRRGELTQDEFETIKSTLKKKLPVANVMVSVSQVLTKSPLSSTWVVYINT
mgnify:CR=1 FL=1